MVYSTEIYFAECVPCCLTLIAECQQQWDGGRICCELHIERHSLAHKASFWNVIQIRVEEERSCRAIPTTHNQPRTGMKGNGKGTKRTLRKV